MSTQNPLVEACAHPLANISNLGREEMRLLGYSDGQAEIDACERANKGMVRFMSLPVHWPIAPVGR
jgi:hypothetical protein